VPIPHRCLPHIPPFLGIGEIIFRAEMLPVGQCLFKFLIMRPDFCRQLFRALTALSDQSSVARELAFTVPFGLENNRLTIRKIPQFCGHLGMRVVRQMPNFQTVADGDT
jgi:hypothetical protein